MRQFNVASPFDVSEYIATRTERGQSASTGRPQARHFWRCKCGASDGPYLDKDLLFNESYGHVIRDHDDRFVAKVFSCPTL